MIRKSGSVNGRPILRVLLVVCLLLGSFSIVPTGMAAATNQSAEANFTAVERSGESIVRTSNGTAYVWKSGSHRINASYTVRTNGVKYTTCLYTPKGERHGRPIGNCHIADSVSNGSTMTESFTVPNNKSSDGTLILVLRRTFSRGGDPIDRRVLNYSVIEKEGDEDGDGLTNYEEVNETRWDINFTTADTDGDGLDDRLEVREYETDPTKKDTDGDGYSDKEEVGVTDPADPDVNPGSETPTAAPTDNESPTPVPIDETDPTTLTVALFALLGVSGVGAVLFKRYGGTAALRARGPSDTHPGSDGTTVTDVDLSEASGLSPSPEPQPSEAPPDETDDLLLTDEDHVYNLVRGNGGRMKQSTIVSETNWSKSKVSRLLSRMDEQGDINKLRVGRGNIIYFDGAEPPAARDPFDGDES